MKSRQVVGTNCYGEPNLAETVKHCPTFQQSTPHVSYFTPHSYWWGRFILISDRSTFSSNFMCCIFARSTIEFFFVRINNWKTWRLFLKRSLRRICHLKQNNEWKERERNREGLWQKRAKLAITGCQWWETKKKKRKKENTKREEKNNKKK